MTRLYLDVDGVINASMPIGWGKTRDGQAGGYTIRWAPALLNALVDLGVEIVWTTTWQEHAVTKLAPLLGFGSEFRYLSPPTQFVDWPWPSIEWKNAAIILDQAAHPEPFIWVDDELHPPYVAHDVEGGLLIGVSPYTGIRPQDVARMRKFVEDNS